MHFHLQNNIVGVLAQRALLSYGGARFQNLIHYHIKKTCSQVSACSALAISDFCLE